MYTRRCVAFALTAAVLLAAGAPAGGPAWGAAPARALRGFALENVERERMTETTFLGVPSAQGALEHAIKLNEEPHSAGTHGDRTMADYMRDRLTEFGFDATLEPYLERLETPIVTSLSLVRPRALTFDLREQADPADPHNARDAGVPFNYGSADGNVTAPLVYANRGLDPDYETLAKARVDVRGAIVLVRYGAEFRGLLAERAQRNGAAAMVFYSDPKDDGYARGAVYPKGPYRPAGSLQRGSVSPGLRIPALPVTATVAQALLGAIGGPAAPRAWEGALPVTYALGRGPGVAHLVVRLKRTRGTIWNTIGKIAGRSSDRFVVLGGHRDAWVWGITDNGSGISTLLEVARGLGYLKKNGWTPKRTIVIAGWDGEELGEYGSRDFVRAHFRELQHGGVAYLNADENVAGAAFGAQASAALAGSIVAATADVVDPVRNSLSVYDRWLQDERARSGTKDLPAPFVGAPGGGSDYEAFLYDIGIPITDFGFQGPLGVWHSAYDNLLFAQTFADPGFALHRTAAQILGLLALRLAEADTIPYEFSAYVTHFSGAIENLSKSTGGIALKPDFSPLRAALARFTRAAAAADLAVARGTGAVSEDHLTAAAQLLDRALYRAEGYRSVLLSPIEGALARGNSAEAAAQIAVAAAALDAAAAQLTP